MHRNDSEADAEITWSKLLVGPICRWGVAQVFRFERSTTTLRERVAAGLIGKPIFARSEFSFPVRTHPRIWINNAKIAGGGPIAMWACTVSTHCAIS